MPKLLQINVTANQGSTGKIAEQIGILAQSSGWDSWIAYGRGNPQSKSSLIRIGNDFDMKLHAIQTRLFDNHGLSSKKVTRGFIEKAARLNPDIIHLHNIHGYYLNYPILFEFLKEWGGHVVWTLHDCWSFTGHCTYFMMSGCEKWKHECDKCPNYRSYPSSLFTDNSYRNFKIKQSAFTSLGNRLTLVPVSHYVEGYICESFLCGSNIQVIHNGIDLNVFKPCKPKERLILGVANRWSNRKGLSDFYELRKLLPFDYRIRLIGLSSDQIKSLPEGIEGITKTNSQIDLAKEYSSALVLVNPTYEDNYPTVNLEAISCGTPVITYRTGGSPESITENTGVVVERGDVRGIMQAIKRIERGGYTIDDCRNYAELRFSQTDCFQSYIDLYNKLIK